MGDMGDIFKTMNKAKKERHSKWYDQNVKIIDNSEFGYEWAGNGTAMLFRYCVQADFYPHTGRWKYKGKMHSGGAEHFLRWYRNRLPVNY